MIDRIIENLVPMLLLRVAAVSTEDKQKFAHLLQTLCAAYLDDNPNEFRARLMTTSFSEEWKTAMCRALWPEELIHENPRQ